MRNFLDRFRRQPTTENPDPEPSAEPANAPTTPVESVRPAPALVPTPKLAWHSGPGSGGQRKRQPNPISQPERKGATEMLTLTVGDFLDRIPEKFLEPGAHDPNIPLPFDLAALSERIGRSETVIPVSEIYRRMPDIFRADAVIGAEVVVRFPWKKVLDLISQAKDSTAAGGLSPAGVETLSLKLKARKFRRTAKPAPAVRLPVHGPSGRPASEIATTNAVATTKEQVPNLLAAQPTPTEPKIFPATTAPSQSGVEANQLKSAAETNAAITRLEAERDAAVARATEFGAEHDAAIARTGELIAERDAAVARATELSAERDSALAQYKELATGRETAIAPATDSTTELTAERDTALARSAELTAERDSALARSAELTAERDSALARSAELTTERDSALARAAQHAADSDAAVALATELTAERDAAVGRATELSQSSAAIIAPAEKPQDAAWESRAIAQFEADIEGYRNSTQALLRERDTLRQAQVELTAQLAGKSSTLGVAAPASTNPPTPDVYSSLFPQRVWLPRAAAALILAALAIGLINQARPTATRSTPTAMPTAPAVAEEQDFAIPELGTAVITENPFTLESTATDEPPTPGAGPSEFAEPAAGNPHPIEWKPITSRPER